VAKKCKFTATISIALYLTVAEALTIFKSSFSMISSGRDQLCSDSRVQFNVDNDPVFNKYAAVDGRIQRSGF
jgi:hypothetical protein